ncbi:MAG TPA: hypothetical protein VF490_09105 [Chryseosolibacter sp.]
MDKKRSFSIQSVSCLYLICLGLILLHWPCRGQDAVIDGKTFKAYKAGAFKPKRPLLYNVYVSPVLTVDPLGISGKSTYGVGIGSRINLWESKASDNSLQGLRIKGFYTSFGYEYFPLQSDNVYASLWLRIKTFMPLAGRIDRVFSFGNGLKGTSTRYCLGFEVKGISVFLAGTTTRFLSPVFGEHPYLNSPYTNVGSILLVVPIVNHYPALK